ncbi:MAG: transcriptional regulator [Bacillota bacterium]
MKFNEKLNLLMNITNTANSVFARNISLDPSFVSRLRRGRRTPAKNENYIKAMAAYFAKNCSADYQKTVLLKTIKTTSGFLPESSESIADLIHKWLSEGEAENSKPIENFLEGFRNFKFKKAPQAAALDVSMMDKSAASDSQVLYGIEGKQNAVITFLSLVLKSKNPQTLLLHSDEDMEWLTGNHEFTAKWAALLSQVIMRGNKIKIIHTVNRSLDEMLSAIKQWVPIYMTGTIEPYYYPKTRDGVFRRTLFIAPDTAAVISTSIGNETKNAANFLLTDKRTIMALIAEYNDFLALCRPLMRIFTPFSKSEYLAVLSEFENEGANRFVKTDALSSITMPIDVAESIHSRMENSAKDQLLFFHQMRIINFENSLQKYSFTEIITIPNLESIQNGKVMINFSDLLGDTPFFYTPREISKHIQNIIRLLQTFDNYNVYLANNQDLAGCMLYVKEDVGVLIGKTSIPSVIFAINESNMTAAFWDYMNIMINKAPKGEIQRKRTIARLEAVLKKLKD